MKGGYPDPFASGVGESCKLYCATTLGPCYVASPERKDVSEGHPGLPVRLVFLVVDESCKPIPGATVDIWHTAPEGLYSGNDAIDFCTGGDAKAKAARWFRGVQTADAGGRVEFDTCYPGWYPGRTIHIHFTVRVGGVEHATSQLIFDDALNDDILTTQPLYKDRGPRDTTNASDGILNSPAYMMQTQKMPDGALLAWKALVIRASLDRPLCQG